MVMTQIEVNFLEDNGLGWQLDFTTSTAYYTGVVHVWVHFGGGDSEAPRSQFMGDFRVRLEENLSRG